MAGGTNPNADNVVKVFRKRAELTLEREHVRFGTLQPPGLPPLPESFKYEPKCGDITSVAIVGAGVAGLRAAMSLSDLLPDTAQIHVYEAAAEDRIGGRLYTHRFSTNPNDPYEYFVCATY